MDSIKKNRYEIDLTCRPAPRPLSPGVRNLECRDLRQLAELMLDAYAGTIDSEGETLEDAIDEVGAYFGAEPLLRHSFLLERDGSILAAVLVSFQERNPFIPYVITAPKHKNQGLAASITSSALDSLKTAGFSTAVLFITDGNAPSEALFAKLGAKRVRTP